MALEHPHCHTPHTYTHARAHTHSHTPHTYTHVRTHTHARAHTRAHTRTPTHTPHLWALGEGSLTPVPRRTPWPGLSPL
uniref:Uncharacterized protein n=1 Tax=Anguilla anguilla TaxID=7936 RepID=A0A0E9UXT6_ANGAN